MKSGSSAKDGALVWVELEASTVNDETGTPLYGIRVVRDITERKHAAEHQRVMMYELDHRVRNTLAIVQSVASHTLRAAGVDRSIAAALTDRLIALAGAHAVLSSESWEGGDLDAVVAKVISAHERIRAKGPAVRLRPSLIVMLSLVLHELATNAAKYGALSNETGWVDLSWKLAGDRLSLSWRESGGPPAEPPRRRGFGSQLIERLIRAEGGAVLSTRYEPVMPRSPLSIEDMSPNGRFLTSCGPGAVAWRWHGARPYAWRTSRVDTPAPPLYTRPHALCTGLFGSTLGDPHATHHGRAHRPPRPRCPGGAARCRGTALGEGSADRVAVAGGLSPLACISLTRSRQGLRELG